MKVNGRRFRKRVGDKVLRGVLVVERGEFVLPNAFRLWILGSFFQQPSQRHNSRHAAPHNTRSGLTGHNRRARRGVAVGALTHAGSTLVGAASFGGGSVGSGCRAVCRDDRPGPCRLVWGPGRRFYRRGPDGHAELEGGWLRQRRCPATGRPGTNAFPRRVGLEAGYGHDRPPALGARRIRSPCRHQHLRRSHGRARSVRRAGHGPRVAHAHRRVRRAALRQRGPRSAGSGDVPPRDSARARLPTRAASQLLKSRIWTARRTFRRRGRSPLCRGRRPDGLRSARHDGLDVPAASTA